jgi:hypothetical protein
MPLQDGQERAAISRLFLARSHQCTRQSNATVVQTLWCALMLVAVCVTSGGCAASTATIVASSIDERAGTYIVTNGTAFLYGGHALHLSGFAFYPALLGGTAAWSRPDFPRYIDEVVALGRVAGQNLVRPTNFWSTTSRHQSWRDPTVWANLDYLVRTAQRHGMFVIMDLSAYRSLLTSQGLDPYDAANWSAFLRFVGTRYDQSPAIAFYSIVGEPTAPTTVAATARLVDFYRTLTDELYAADHGHHLITAGGLIHLEDESDAMQWWQEIAALPHNEILAIKTYSQADLNLLPTIAKEARQLRKPLVNEEFGMPQYVGDTTPTGRSYNSLRMSRAQFYTIVYIDGARYGMAAVAFWNLGCQVSTTSYEVSPLTPAVWRIVTQYGPGAHVAWPYASPPCQAE